MITDALQETVSMENKVKNYKLFLVPSLEVLQNSQLEFKDKPELTSVQIETFVKEHVRIVRSGNVDITIIDQEHDEYKGQLDPVLKVFLESPRTKTAVVEYFLPELKQNSPPIPEGIKKIIGSIDNLAKEGRGNFFMDIAEVMKEENKNVSCVDIANNLNYELLYAAYKSRIPEMFLIGLNKNIPGIDRLLLFYLIPLTSWGIDAFTEADRKGIYNKNNITELQNLYTSMEDARRIYAAKGLEQMANDYKNEYPTKTGDTRPQIVVIYPRAHAIRIANYMTNTSTFTKIAKATKSLIYHFPGLEYSYRTYSWKDSLAKLSGKPEMASWQITTSKKFSLI